MADGQHGGALNAGSQMRDYIAPVLSLFVGMLVLLPTAIGPVSRPFALGTLLPVFIVLSLISIGALVVAHMVSSWTSPGAAGVMHKAHGVGNWTGALSLIAAAIFLWTNYAKDISAPPQILNVKVNPVQPEAGRVVEVDLEIGNPTGRPLAFRWELDGRQVAGLRTAYIKMPDLPGTYLVTASVKSDAEAETTLVAGASAVANGREPREGESTVRLWLEVVETANVPGTPTTAPTPPQTIIQICNEDRHGRRSQGTAHRQGASRAASSPGTGPC